MSSSASLADAMLPDIDDRVVAPGTPYEIALGYATAGAIAWFGLRLARVPNDTLIVSRRVQAFHGVTKSRAGYPTARGH